MISSIRIYRVSTAIAAALAVMLGSGCSSAAPLAPGPAPAVAAAPAAPAPLATAALSAPEATPAVPYKNTVRWTTASEVDSFGFDVFRGELEEGPFLRLNAKPIAGAGTSDESHSYAYVDETIDPMREYFYYVESISMDGVREKFTPVSRARAKIAPAASPVP